MARSALSSLIDMGDSCAVTFGKHPLVKRLMKGIFESNPSFPRYNMVWNVNTLFAYFRSLDTPANMDVGPLGKKLALLMCILAGGQRSQTLHCIQVSDIKILEDKCIISIFDKIKQTRPGKHMKPLEFRVYLREPKLCVVENLKEYLKKTQSYRKVYPLFISYQKPYGAVTKDTIARWCKHTLREAGIDIDKYSSHSSRSAASSYAAAKGLSLKKISAAAGWSRERTFAQYYKKDIEEDRTIGQSILP